MVVTVSHKNNTVQNQCRLYLSDSTCQPSGNLLADAGCQGRGCWCKFTNNCLQS